MTENTPPTPADQPDRLERLEHYQHWWREIIAGVIAIAIACFDIWTYGHEGGFSSSLDEILILTGVALVAGVKNLFGDYKRNGRGPLP